MKQNSTHLSYGFALLMIAFAMVCVPGPAPAGDENLDRLTMVIGNINGIRTIDAEIVQHIQTEGRPREVYRGRYRADSTGRVRIDYTVPSRQIVFNDGKGFYWYYPDDRLLYRIERPASETPSSSFNPMKEVANTSSKVDENLVIRYRGRRLYGFFGTALYYSVTDARKGIRVDLAVDPVRPVVLEKTVRGRGGMELMHEHYERYVAVDGLYFPGRVTVTVRSSKGITSNTTEYSRIELNGRVPVSVFHPVLPAGLKVKTIQ